MWKWDFHRSIPKGKKATVWLFVFDGSECVKLRPAQEYHYLNQSDCLSIDNIDDAEQFHILRVCWTNWLHYRVWDAINLVFACQNISYNNCLSYIQKKLYGDGSIWMKESKLVQVL
jgi:hypothetical protein